MMEPIYEKMWRVTFGMIRSYDVIAPKIETAIRLARKMFKDNHTFSQEVTGAELIGKAANPLSGRSRKKP